MFSYRIECRGEGKVKLGKQRCLIILLIVAGPSLWGEVSGPRRDLEAAALAERAGHYEEAASRYQRFLSGADPSKTDPQLLLHARTRLATAYFLLHRYQESLDAVASLTSGKARDADVPAQAWLVAGLDCLELQRLPEAVAALRHALVANPGSGTARLALGDALAQSGRVREAVEEYQEQTQRTPSQPDAWYKLGLAYARLATQISQDADQKLPTSVLARQLTAENLLATAEYQGAAGLLLRLVRQAPGQPQIHADFGAALLALGYAKAAEDQFRQELSEDHDCPAARLGLAEAAALRGNWDQAISAVDLLTRFSPRELARLIVVPAPEPLRHVWAEGKIPLPPRLAGSPAGRFWQNWLTRTESASMPAAAEPAGHACSSVTSKAMNTPGLWIGEACYSKLRDRLKARLQRTKDLTLPERIKLAEAEFRLGNYQTARLEAEGVLKLNPQSDWGAYWLSLSSSELADECLAKVASLNPESARAHQILGEYYTRRHNFPRAKAEYLAAIRLTPDLADLHLGLGTVCWASEEWIEAERELHKTLELAPGSAVAQYELGDTYIRQRRWQAAADHLRRILQDPVMGTKARIGLAEAEAQMGQTHQAVDDLLPAAKEDPDGQIHYRLASLYRKLGDKVHEKEALAAFKRLQAESPNADRDELDALDRSVKPSENPDPRR
jgi:tetratricopeptide (TPR) repeat protein